MELSEALSQQLEAEIGPVVEELGLELVEISLKSSGERRILEIILDKGGHLTVDDCALASKKISYLLDVEDLFPFQYNLEVSSPGIFREFKSEKEFKKYTGHRVKAQFNTMVKGRKRFTGTLQAFNPPIVTLSDEQNELEVELTNIKKINLAPKL